MAGQLWAVKGANSYSLSDENVNRAAKVFAYAGMRIALAGTLYYAMSKYKTDPLRSTLIGAFVSALAAIMFWAGKMVVDGAKAGYTNFQTPLTREFAMGLGRYILGVVILNFHNYKKIGIVEYFAPSVLTPATINKRPY